MGKVLLINAAEAEERRIALVEEGRLEEFRVERGAGASLLGNIYKGRVVNLERGIAAAFVDVGVGRNGFLHVSDCPAARTDGRARIEDHVKLGEEILVQVTRDSVGAKGPVLSANLSLPGRFVVLLPNTEAGGVSRRIEGEDDRAKLRALAKELGRRAGAGVIVRTAAGDRSQRELARDVDELRRLWESIRERAASTSAPALLHAESDLVVRALRDLVARDVEEIHVDRADVLRRAEETLDAIQPELKERLRLHTGPEPLFHVFGVEAQVDRVRARRVALPGGGSIVFDRTEALVAVDVNSGRTREDEGLEETARRTNLEAADEIARQLRLRDLGGVIAVDFIDMREAANVRDVERAFKAALKRDRAHIRTGKMGPFGVFVLTRRRVGPGEGAGRRPCSSCGGSGQAVAPDEMALRAYRDVLARAASRSRSGTLVRLHPDAAAELLARRGDSLRALEASSGRAIRVEADPALAPDAWRVEALRLP
jgi:ribonuclease E